MNNIHVLSNLTQLSSTTSPSTTTTKPTTTAPQPTQPRVNHRGPPEVFVDLELSTPNVLNFHQPFLPSTTAQPEDEESTDDESAFFEEVTEEPEDKQAGVKLNPSEVI